MRKRYTDRNISTSFKRKEDWLLSVNILKTFTPSSPVPHVLIQLSQREHQRLACNCIHLEDLSICPTTGSFIFNKVNYGKNLKKKKKTILFLTINIPSYEIPLEKTKRRFFMITANKTDCIKVLPNLLTSSSTYNSNPSNIVVLLACIFKESSKKNKVWIGDDFSRLKKCKPNILQSSAHHGSTGYYASFGNKGSFDKAVSTSIGQYTCKKKESVSKQLVVNKEATLYEQWCADELGRSVKDLSTIIPNIASILSPVVQVAFDTQLIDGKDLNLTENLASNDGCFQSSICVNAETREYHVEHDCTYTLITIPNQSKTKDSLVDYDFLFKLSSKQSLNISLKSGVTFMFSGLFLRHRQNKSHESTKTQEPFFNMASYGNKRLFYHLRKTLNKV